MRNFLSFLLLLCIFHTSFAQYGEIIGTIADNSNAPIAYAGVALSHTHDSSLVKGTLSEKDGTFKLTEIKNGEYFIKIFFLGYEDWYSQKITISNTQPTINLNVIQLKTLSTTLKMAEVTFTKPLFEEKQGKMIMNVEAQPTATGDNVLELLRKMPSVTVDYNDNISILGKSGVMIMIDDKPTYLSGDDLINLLKSMPSASIDKIEVIKNPSSRFDAAGTAGIINIVLKKNLSNGINGSVYAGGGYSGSFQHNEGGNITARIKKVVINASYYYLNFKSKNSEQLEERSTFNNITTRLMTNEKDNELWGGKSKWQSHGYNIGLDYYIDKKNSIGFSYRGNIGLGEWENSSFIRLYRSDIIPDSSYSRNSLSTFNSNNQTFSCDYKHEFDSLGKILYANITYSINDAKNMSDNELNYFYNDFVKPAYRNNFLKNESGPNLMQVITAKIDYEQPINESINVEMGVKSSFIFNNNKSFNFENDSCLQSQSNRFNYKENIDAAYVLLNASPSQLFNIQVGLRAEYSSLEGILLTTKERNKQQYIDIFPSFEFGYVLPKMQQVSISYRNRISRPEYNVLNPYISITDQYNISTGNPNLAPEYSHHIEANYSWRYMLFTALSYNYSQGKYADVQYTNPQSLLRISRPENIGKSHIFGASIYARIPIGKWWLMSYSLNGNIGKSFFDYGSKIVAQNIHSGHFYSSQLFTFLKNYSVDISAWGMLPSNSMFGQTRGLFAVNFGGKAMFLQQTLTVKLSLQDIFNQGRWIDHSVYPDGASTHSEWRWEGRRLWLQVTYRFGKQDLKLREKRTESLEEIERMGGGKQQGDSKGGFQQPN